MGNVDTAGSTGTSPRFDWVGIDRERGGLGGGDDAGSGAPRVPEYGLSSGTLYYYQREFTKYAADRLLGVGHEQYDRADHQKFEDMSPRQLAEGLREELADIVNYATMLDIRLGRLLVLHSDVLDA